MSLPEDAIEPTLRRLMERYLDAMNTDNARKLALATMGAAFFDNDFDERSVSPYHQVAPFIWIQRDWRDTAGNTILEQLRVLAYSDDVAAAHVIVGFEHPPENTELPDPNRLVMFQRIKTRWRISAIVPYRTKEP